jgi:hypothetical protein
VVEVVSRKGTWPFIRLSNGFEMEIYEVLRVRCLRDFPSERREGTFKAKRGQIVALRHGVPGHIEMVKAGSGNRNWTDICRNPEEGRDFELLPDEKMALIYRPMREADPVREAREVGPLTRE